MVQGLERLSAAVAQRGNPGADAWLVQALEGLTVERVRVSLARCARKVGDAPLDEPAGWTARDAARAALVLKAFETAAMDEVVTAYGQWLRRGEQGEQESLLRMLPMLPHPEALLPHAVEACRTNSEVVFRAIACNNPYPAAHFPELAFNQMVLKAVFLGVQLSHVQGLKPRVGPELLRMADDFAAERTAAGRVVPDDIALLHTLSETA
jgi:hypothetical protein